MRHCIFIAAIVLASSLLAVEDPMVLKPSDDTYLTVTHTGKPGGRGESADLQIYGQAKDQFRVLLKFDLSGVKAPPTQAIIRVFAWNVGQIKKTELIRCHPVLREWTEKTASWDMALADDQWVNAGGDWDPIAAGGCNVNSNMSGEKGYWLEFDVTRLAQAWVSKQKPNFGVVLLFDPGCSSEIRCRSKENGSNPPELKLAWNTKLDRGPGMVPGDKIKPYGDPVKMEPVFTTFSLSIVKANEKFSQMITAKGGIRPYKFTATGAPEGVTLAESGELSGTPAKVGKASIMVTCTSADGKKASKALEFIVKAADEVVAEKKVDLGGGGGGGDKKAPPAAKKQEEE